MKTLETALIAVGDVIFPLESYLFALFKWAKLQGLKCRKISENIVYRPAPTQYSSQKFFETIANILVFFEATRGADGERKKIAPSTTFLKNLKILIFEFLMIQSPKFHICFYIIILFCIIILFLTFFIFISLILF